MFLSAGMVMEMRGGLEVWRFGGLKDVGEHETPGE